MAGDTGKEQWERKTGEEQRRKNAGEDVVKGRNGGVENGGGLTVEEER